MRSRIFLLFLAAFSPLWSDSIDDALRLENIRVDAETRDWLRQVVHQDLEIQREAIEHSPLGKVKCRGNFKENTDLAEKPAVLVFASFSMPDSVWIKLSKELAPINGVFVLRGLPNNSFVDLSRKLLALKKQGLEATVQIDPRLFEKYNIGSVPTFVVADENTFDKVVGSVSLDFVLEQMSAKGETALAQELNRKRRGGD